MTKFQSRKISFPTIGYCAFIWLLLKSNNEEEKYPFLMSEVYHTQQEAVTESEKLINDPDISYKCIKETILISKIKLDKTVPLKKEFWEKSIPNPKYAEIKNKSIETLKAFTNLSKYKILIVPCGKKENGNENLRIAFAFKKSAKKEISEFMLGSDMYVDPTAKDSALYSVVDIYGMNINDGKKIKNGVSFWEN